MRPAGRILILVSAALPALLPAAARAGGYDTPMLYSARHIGMGGTAIGYVDEPSAIFHNPAGLAQIGHFSVTADTSLLLARVRSTPAFFNANDVRSEQTVAPLGLLGGGVRLNETVSVGLGVYPIALAGATYKYSGIEDKTRLVFLEASPAVALNLPGHVRLGGGYRVTYANVERFSGTPAEPFLDFTMDGFNWKGFRVGAQWTPIPWLQAGAVYRHKTVTHVSNDSGIAAGVRYTDIETEFVLPSRMGGGLRADVWHLGLALDGEYAFNSQNGAHPLVGLPPGTPEMPAMRTAVPNIFNWTDEVTVRGGLELRFGFVPKLARLAARGGYIYDGKTTNAKYPSAFGTPPGPTRVITAGLGWKGNTWQVNTAFAHRTGSGAVTDPDTTSCRFCGYAGKLPYRIWVTGFYLDFSYGY